jgi:hypothetical protein
MTLPYISLGIYLVAGIFYIMPSGQPQPADLLLVLTIAFVFTVWRTLPRLPDLYMALIMFCSWIVAVNMCYFAMYNSNDFLIRSMYYIFNVSIFIFIVMAGHRDWERLRTVIRWACVVALFVQLAHLILVGATTVSGVRSVGTFNNPNQLGYWVLLAMANLAVAKDREPLTMIDLAALTAGGYALLLSLSKAATVSGGILIIMILLFRHVRHSWAVVAMVFAIGVVAVGLSISDQAVSWGPADALGHRFSSHHADDDIMVRGYQVIVENPEYWFFGAGEGEYPRRFAGGVVKLEIHSTIGSLFFSYGLVGLGLFGLVLWIVFRHAPLSNMAYFIPIMMYGVTHNGIRFSELWIFLALVYVQRRYGSIQSSPDTSRTAMVTTGSPPHRTRSAPQWSQTAPPLRRARS